MCSFDSSAHRRHVTSVMKEYGFDTRCNEQEEINNFNDMREEENKVIYDWPQQSYGQYYNFESKVNETEDVDRRLLVRPAESRKFIDGFGISFGVGLTGSASSLFGSDGPLTISWRTSLSYTLNSNTFSFGITIT